MTSFWKALCLLALTGLLTACSSEAKKDPLLEEAARYHNEATAIQAALEPKIEQIDSVRALLTRRTEPTAQAAANRLDSLKKAFTEWEANIVEVPGMPHEHHHHGEGEHHHHHDETLKDLPADQMRDLQREARATIERLQTRTQAALQEAETLLK